MTFQPHALKCDNLPMGNDDQSYPASIGPFGDSLPLVHSLKARVEELRMSPELSGDGLIDQLEAVLQEIQTELGLD
jgi:hypothetical protein